MKEHEIILKKEKELLERKKMSTIQLKKSESLTLIHTLIHPTIEAARSGKYVRNKA